MRPEPLPCDLPELLDSQFGLDETGPEQGLHAPLAEEKPHDAAGISLIGVVQGAFPDNTKTPPLLHASQVTRIAPSPDLRGNACRFFELAGVLHADNPPPGKKHD